MEVQNAPSPKTVIRSCLNNKPKIIKELETTSVYLRLDSSAHNAAASDPSTEDNVSGKRFQMDSSSSSFEFSSDMCSKVKLIPKPLRHATAQIIHFCTAAFIFFFDESMKFFFPFPSSFSFCYFEVKKQNCNMGLYLVLNANIGVFKSIWTIQFCNHLFCFVKLGLNWLRLLLLI